MKELEAHRVRDLVQARLLAAIFSNSLKGELALKGGLAMRAMLSSIRYTSDIDLAVSSPSVPKRTVEACMERAVAELKSAGVMTGITFKPAEQTDVKQRWKIRGLVGSHEVILKVEVSRRALHENADFVSAKYESRGLGPIAVACVPLSLLAAGKVDCMKNPIREAPRDVYDLYLLITMDVRPSAKALADYYSREDLVNLRQRVCDKMDKMDYVQAKEKLLPFLPPDAAAKITPDVWNTMTTTVGCHVSKWAEEAIAVQAGGESGYGDEDAELAPVPA